MIGTERMMMMMTKIRKYGNGLKVTFFMAILMMTMMTESVFVGVIIFCDATKLKRNNFMFFPSDSILRVSMSPNFLSFVRIL